MRGRLAVLGALCGVSLGCAGAVNRGTSGGTADTPAAAGQGADRAVSRAGTGQVLGFDRNDYPGDAAMATLRKTFAFTGYWVSNPPGETANSWVGKRTVLRGQGWGFLVLANGRLDAEILKAQKAGTPAAEQGRQDAARAVKQVQVEGFPPRTVIFLDQEEGGRLLEEQAGYLLGWTEAVAASGFRAGVYASGQTVEDGPGQRIDTVQDIRARVKAGHLHGVAIFDALDACPPAPGCSLHAAPLSAVPDPDVVVWQYAQSPRRPEITKTCRATYAADGNCYAPGVPGVFLDLNVSASTDPSGGR